MRRWRSFRPEALSEVPDHRGLCGRTEAETYLTRPADRRDRAHRRRTGDSPTGVSTLERCLRGTTRPQGSFRRRWRSCLKNGPTAPATGTWAQSVQAASCDAPIRNPIRPGGACARVFGLRSQATRRLEPEARRARQLPPSGPVSDAARREGDSRSSSSPRRVVADLGLPEGSGQRPSFRWRC